MVVRFKGQDIETVLDLAARHGINFWGVERLTTDIVIGRIGVRQFRRLRPLLWNREVSAAIVDRRGLPFTFHKLSQRAFFILGMGIVCLIILYLSSFIWFIEVTGNEQLTTDEVLDFVVDQGLHVGLKRQDFSAKSLENKLLAQFEMLAWVGVRLQGTKVHIELVERSIYEPALSLVGNIVAERDGLITELFVLRGTPFVTEGDTVRQGEVLISGEYYDPWGRKQVGRAEGAVHARVWYESFAEGSLSRLETRRLGGHKRQLLIHIGPLTIPLGFGPPYKEYSTETLCWKLPINGSKPIIGVTKLDHYEVKYTEIPISSEEALQEALSKAWAYLDRTGVDLEQVRQYRIQEDPIEDGNGIRVHLYVEVEENIARFLPIP